MGLFCSVLFSSLGIGIRKKKKMNHLCLCLVFESRDYRVEMIPSRDLNIRSSTIFAEASID